MNITISRAATLRIVRSLAAAQVLADRRGNGTGPHPLAFLLDDPDTTSPLTASLFTTALIETLTVIAPYAGSISPLTDSAAEVTISIPLPRTAAAHTGGLLRSLLEEFTAMHLIRAILINAPVKASNSASAFTTLASTRLTAIHTLLASADPTLSGLVIRPDF